MVSPVWFLWNQKKIQDNIRGLLILVNCLNAMIGATGNRKIMIDVKGVNAQYTKLLYFSGTAHGALPIGNLISDETFLYGMTSQQ